MRKIILTLLILPFFTYAQVYQTIKPLEELGGPEYQVYYKDMNNVLNGFEGVYEYNGPNFYFKMELKKIFSNLNYFCKDAIIGKYQYIRDGVDINYMNDNLTGVTTEAGAKIKFSWIRKSMPPVFCPQCLPEKWLAGHISDPVTHKTAWLYMAKRTIGGQQGIQVWFHLEASTQQPWESDDPIQLPISEFFMAKIQ